MIDWKPVFLPLKINYIFHFKFCDLLNTGFGIKLTLTNNSSFMNTSYWWQFLIIWSNPFQLPFKKSSCCLYYRFLIFIIDNAQMFTYVVINNNKKHCVQKQSGLKVTQFEIRIRIDALLMLVYLTPKVRIGRIMGFQLISLSQRILNNTTNAYMVWSQEER